MTEELENRIHDALIGNRLREFEMQDTIREMLGENYEVEQFDSWIDDGCYDNYVKGAGFTVTSPDGEETDIRVFYGDVTFEIGCVEFQ